jgi:hypothetical protein
MSVILKRKHPRRAFRREVILSCQVVRERDFRLVSELALDLSTQGMLVSTDLRVLTGEPLLVSFRPPRSDRWLDVSAGAPATAAAASASRSTTSTPPPSASSSATFGASPPPSRLACLPDSPESMRGGALCARFRAPT